MSTVQLKKFDMKSITFKADEAEGEAKGPVIVLLGKRDTGKSFLISDIMYYFQTIPIGTVISGTEMGNRFYEKLVPKIFIHHEYSNGIIQNVLIRQKQIVNKRNEQMSKYNGKTNIDARAFVIMDDCLYDDKWAREKLMRLMFMNGRHWKLLLIISLQYPLGVPPILRTNIDYVFILRENIRGIREKIWRNYASMFHTLDSFCEVMDQTTQNYECLVIHNGSKSNNLSDQVYWYKASRHPEYKLCSKEFWDLSKDLPDAEDEEYNPSNSKKGPHLTVKKQGT
jgi:hypothetical protein